LQAGYHHLCPSTKPSTIANTMKVPSSSVEVNPEIDLFGYVHKKSFSKEGLILGLSVGTITVDSTP